MSEHSKGRFMVLNWEFYTEETKSEATVAFTRGLIYYIHGVTNIRVKASQGKH